MRPGRIADYVIEHAEADRATFCGPMARSPHVTPRDKGTRPLRAAGAMSWSALAVALALTVLPACGGAGSGAVVRGPQADIAMGPVPSSWRRVEVDDALRAFRDDEKGATVAVNARCGKDADDVPLEALRRHLFIYFTDREIVSEQTIQLDGRDALVTVARARLDGVQKGFIVYVLKKDGCVYDLMCISEPETQELVRPEFERFALGFRTIAK